MATGPYRIDNVWVDTVAVATNNPFTSAFRGFGGPQPCFAYERQMDEIARALGLDPLEVRRINYLRTGDTTATGQVVGTELEFVIMVIAVSCVKLLSAHNSTQHTSRKHKV
jgi:Aerobic-type carbon monoxide dehydrogenase, large subunit CoxL/CutL homologs